MPGRVERLNGGGPVATISSTGLSSLATTTLYTPTVSGFFRLSVYAVCRTTGAGNLSPTITYADTVQAQSDTPYWQIGTGASGSAASINMNTGIGTNGWFTMELYATSGTAITLALANTSTGTFDLHVWLDQI